MNGKSSLFALAMAFGLVKMAVFGADEESWKEETFLVSREGDFTLVRSVGGSEILFASADPQLAIE